MCCSFRSIVLLATAAIAWGTCAQSTPRPTFVKMTSRIVLALVAAMFSSSVRSQSALDSLLRVLPAKSGAERVRALGDVQWELGFSDPEKALAYGLEAMKLAEGLKDSAVIAQAANDLSISEYRLGHFQRSIVLSRRALAIRQEMKDTLGVAACHNNCGSTNH